MIRFLLSLALNLFRVDGPLVPFDDTDPGVTPPTSVPPVDQATPPGLVPAATPRPGHGAHADDCAYIDIIGHRCVNESGQPSHLVCHATVMRNQLRASIPHCVCGHPVADHKDRAGWCRSCGCSYPEKAAA